MTALSEDPAADWQDWVNEVNAAEPSVFTPPAAVTCRGSDEREVAGLERLAAAHANLAEEQERLAVLQTGLTTDLGDLIRRGAI